jgi:hypothetical protein
MHIIRFIYFKVQRFYKKIESKRIERANKKRLEYYISKGNNSNEVKNVLFVVIHKSVWKLDTVFKKMLESSEFNPTILVAPHTAFGHEQMLLDLNESYDFFKSKKYPVVKGFDGVSKLDHIKLLNPDIIFFTNPHDLTFKEYYTNLFKNFISYYVPYYYQISKWGDYSAQYDQMFHNSMHRIFSPHNIALELHQTHSTNKGKNVIVTGYPAMEPFMNKYYKPNNPWITQEKEKLRVIWAPHHTINSPELPYSNFLKYALFFKELAQKTKDNCQWAFKPHPILKPKLINHPDWGKEKTELYWNFWSENLNCQIEEGDYTDLFLTSDALIHDSGSFLVEYLYVNKPVLFLTSTLSIKNYFNELGCEAFDSCYKAFTKEDIIKFMESLYEKYDPMILERNRFISKHIKPVFANQSPSDLIIASIVKDFNLDV